MKLVIAGNGPEAVVLRSQAAHSAAAHRIVSSTTSTTPRGRRAGGFTRSTTKYLLPLRFGSAISEIAERVDGIVRSPQPFGDDRGEPAVEVGGGDRVVTLEPIDTLGADVTDHNSLVRHHRCCRSGIRVQAQFTEHGARTELPQSSVWSAAEHADATALDDEDTIDRVPDSQQLIARRKIAPVGVGDHR